MGDNYKDNIIISFKDIKNNPAILIPDLLFIILTTVLTTLFLYLNGLLKGTKLNFEYIKEFVITTFSSTPLLVKLIISFLVITSLNILLGITLTTTKYSMAKKIVQKKEVNIIESYYEGLKFVVQVFTIKALILIMYFLPFIIFSTLEFQNDIVVLISSLIVLAIWIMIKLSFFFVYPTMMLGQKNGPIRTLRSSYKYFKSNKKHTIICTLITILLGIIITYVLSILGGLLSGTFGASILTSVYTLFSTLVLVIIGVWALLFSFRSY